MNDLRKKAFLRGMGSVMDIYPSEDIYERSIPKGTAEERLGQIWSRVGDRIRFGIEVVGEEASAKQQAERD